MFIGTSFCGRLANFLGIAYEFFYAFKRVMDFHKTPICLVEWEASNEGILSEDNEIQIKRQKIFFLKFFFFISIIFVSFIFNFFKR